MAILDLDVLTVDPDRRDMVFNDIIAQQGPPDGTVVVTMATGEEFTDDAIDGILDTFGEVGDIILVR